MVTPRPSSFMPSRFHRWTAKARGSKQLAQHPGRARGKPDPSQHANRHTTNTALTPNPTSPHPKSHTLKGRAPASPPRALY